jgi:hypothetical protein
VISFRTNFDILDSLALSPDGIWLAALEQTSRPRIADELPNLLIWDLRDPSQDPRHKTRKRASKVGFSPDSKQLLHIAGQLIALPVPKFSLRTKTYFKTSHLFDYSYAENGTALLGCTSGTTRIDLATGAERPVSFEASTIGAPVPIPYTIPSRPVPSPSTGCRPPSHDWSSADSRDRRTSTNSPRGIIALAC